MPRSLHAEVHNQQFARPGKNIKQGNYAAMNGARVQKLQVGCIIRSHPGWYIEELDHFPRLDLEIETNLVPDLIPD